MCISDYHDDHHDHDDHDDNDDNVMIILISMAMAAVKYAEEKVDNVHAGGKIMMI